ncbi:MAG TPA: copper resistance protein CopC [Gemmatimonadaceae bacterium]|nr:copper resistance protein CopC [Gemmatimonadaceae bacterium]
MTRSTTGARRLLPVLALTMLAVAPSVAHAHTSLRRSEPARDARLTTTPTRLVLWFTAKPQVAFSKLTLLGPSGAIPLGAIAADTGNALRADISAPLAPGEYTVQWQTASADGHPITGSFSFIVLGPPAGALASPAPPAHHRMAGMTPPHTASQTAHVGHTEYRTARWVEFVALLTVLGALGFRHGVLPPLAARGVPTSDAGERARRFGASMLILYAIAALTRAYNESVAIHGSAEALDPAQVWPMLTTTVWGTGWLFGVVGAGLLALGWRLSRGSTSIGTPLALTGAVGMVLSPALSGHAAASEHFVLSVALDVLHVVAASLWLGGLFMVLFAGIPAMKRIENGNRDAAVSALVNSFHPLALFCAPLVVLAGVGSAWLNLGSVTALWQTDYGMTLIRKTVVVVLVLAMGAYNSFRARRRLAEAGGARRILVSGGMEILFAAVVLALTTVLVTQPAPAESLLR